MGFSVSGLSEILGKVRVSGHSGQHALGIDIGQVMTFGHARLPQIVGVGYKRCFFCSPRLAARERKLWPLTGS